VLFRGCIRLSEAICIEDAVDAIRFGNTIAMGCVSLQCSCIDLIPAGSVSKSKCFRSLVSL